MSQNREAGVRNERLTGAAWQEKIKACPPPMSSRAKSSWSYAYNDPAAPAPRSAERRAIEVLPPRLGRARSDPHAAGRTRCRRRPPAHSDHRHGPRLHQGLETLRRRTTQFPKRRDGEPYPVSSRRAPHAGRESGRLPPTKAERLVRSRRAQRRRSSSADRAGYLDIQPLVGLEVHDGPRCVAVRHAVGAGRPQIIAERNQALLLLQGRGHGISFQRWSKAVRPGKSGSALLASK